MILNEKLKERQKKENKASVLRESSPEEDFTEELFGVLNC